jgi:DNA gyrase subunit A
VKLEQGQPKVSLLTASQLVPEKDTWLTVTGDGLVARTLENKLPRLSGNEAPVWVVKANSRDTLYLVAENGEAAALPVHAIPEADKPSLGVPLHQVSTLRESDQLAAMFTLPPRSGSDEEKAVLDEWFVLTVTRQGMVKKSALSELPGASANNFTLVRVNDRDRLGWLRLSNGKNEVLLLTAKGMAIRFKESDVRSMGLVAAGVMGVKLQAKDEVVGAELLPTVGNVFMVSANGRGKRVRVSQFPTQGRYGQGVVAWKLAARDKVVGMTVGKPTLRVTLQMSRLAAKSARLDDAPLQGRVARGKVIQDVGARNKITQLTLPWAPPRPAPKKKRGRARKSKRG